jgi:KAP family P-loop domain
MAEIRTVRDTEPRAVLMFPGAAGELQPYLPRDVDAELDKALAKPSFVLLVHGHAAGTRRTAYEALVRNLPNAVLVVDPEFDELNNFDPDGEAVVWIDRLLSDDGVELRQLERLNGWWSAGKRRWVLTIVREGDVDQPLIKHLAAYLATDLVRISDQLSERERTAAAALFPNRVSASTMQELVGSIGEPDTRHSAAYHADGYDGVDRLGITADVRMLADLMTSRLIEPPLSIGLFGSWGSGKSFFMRQMHQRVRTLADAARAAEQAAGAQGRAVSSYCSSVRQITFNAWHYTEANLWASLATHIFDNLAASGTEDDLRWRTTDLADQRKAEDSLLDQLSTVRMERMLLTAHQEQQTTRRRTPRAVTTALLRSLTREDLSWIASELDVPSPGAEDVRRFADEFVGLHGETRGLWQRLRSDPVPYVVLGGGLLVVVGLSLVLGWTGWTGLAGVLTVVGAAATTMARLRTAVGRIRAVADKLDAPDQHAVATAKRIAELDDEEDRLQRAVADLAPGHDAAAFAQSRHGSQDYRQHLGVVSLLRRDLDTFAAMLDRERGSSDGTTGVERIVLYIDDLDRCPPAVVIQVLEAVHLLLALRLFVVVVGVDARWLTRAIRLHYAAMLDGGAGARPDDDTLAANYLEKIFQVPFVVSPMGENGFATLVRGLADTEEAEDLVPVPHISRVLVGEPTRQAERPSATSTAQPTTPPVAPELRPPRLRISKPELTFLTTLAPLVGSPRATKRLVNLYRLVRARFSRAELERFVGTGNDAPCRAVLVLLAALVGQPGSVQPLFAALAAAPPEQTLTSVLATLDANTTLHAALSRLTTSADAPPAFAQSYQEWLPLVSRFSFAVSSPPANTTPAQD